MKWPDEPTVRTAVLAWADGQKVMRDDLLGVGYFGSYARGEWTKLISRGDRFARTLAVEVVWVIEPASLLA